MVSAHAPWTNRTNRKPNQRIGETLLNDQPKRQTKRRGLMAHQSHNGCPQCSSSAAGTIATRHVQPQYGLWCQRFKQLDVKLFPVSQPQDLPRCVLECSAARYVIRRSPSATADF